MDALNYKCNREPKYKLEVLYEWAALDYKWPPWISPIEMQRQGKFIPENNAIYSMEAFLGDIFVNVGRGAPSSNYRDATGVPATLNRVVIWNGRPVLDPYPSWEANKIGNCNALQNVAVLKVDKSTGLLWAVDMGTVNRFPLCAPKLMIFNAKSGALVRKHVFHKSVVNGLASFIVDLALGQFQGQTRYAFLADITDYKMVIYDFVTDKSWFIKDKSMQFQTCGSRVVAGDDILNTLGGIRSIAVTPDSKYVYYSAVGGFNFYQIPIAAIAANPGADCSKYIRNIGETPLQSNFMTGGVKKVYFADHTRNALKAWDRTQDLGQCKGENEINIKSYETIARDDYALQFINALALDNGYLYFMSNNLAGQRTGSIMFNDPCKPNFIIGRVFVDDVSPLQVNRPSEIIY